MSMDGQLMIDLEKLGENYGLNIHRMFEAAGIALKTKINTGEWPALDTLIKTHS